MGLGCGGPLGRHLPREQRASRRGPVKALGAVEHAILIAIWNMLTNGVFYVDLGGDYFTRLNPDKTKDRAPNQLRQMGSRSPSTPSKQLGEENLPARAMIAKIVLR